MASIEKTIYKFKNDPVIFTFVDTRKNSAYYSHFGTTSKLLVFRPKKRKFAEYTNSNFDENSIEMFISGVISGNGRFQKLSSDPSFEFKHEDL